jgi:LPS export ABC transporter protein LptC
MKLDRKKGFVIAAAVLAVLATAVILYMHNRADTPVRALKVLAENVDLQIKNILFTEVGGSGEKWEIRAETAQYMRKENVVLFDKVSVKLVLDDGKTFLMTGDKGRFMTTTKDMDVVGNVVIISDQGDRYTTDHLNYSNAGKKIFTDGSVMMENARMKITGVGMNLLMQAKELKILSKVKVQTK